MRQLQQGRQWCRTSSQILTLALSTGQSHYLSSTRQLFPRKSFLVNSEHSVELTFAEIGGFTKPFDTLSFDGELHDQVASKTDESCGHVAV